MAEATSNFGLIKPDGTEVIDIDNLNSNADTIDAALQSLKPLVKTVTISTSNWGSTTLTASKTVTGVTGSSVVFVAPQSSYASEWYGNGVYLSSQSTDTLTFKCSSIPSNTLVANLVIFTNTRSS